MVAQSAVKPVVTPKVKKEPIAPVAKITESLKRAAIAGKISKDELDAVSNLAVALKTFMGT